MKIIGKTCDSEFIVTASKDELAKICGFNSAYGMKDDSKIAVGREVSVSELYAALLVSRQRKDEIADLANKLRAVAGRVDSINQALASPIVEVKTS